jgi:hypothetical protein
MQDCTIYICDRPFTADEESLDLLENALERDGWFWDDALGWHPNQIDGGSEQ